MFARKKPNPSGVVSIKIIDKSSGNYKVIKTIGSSADADEIEDRCGGLLFHNCITLTL
jgi:hypothetical protein